MKFGGFNWERRQPAEMPWAWRLALAEIEAMFAGDVYVARAIRS